jgi:ribosomal protein S18 acetylase RimI-like enzyme
MQNWLDTVEIRLMRETDLPSIEWGEEYIRYRKVYRDVYRNFLAGRSILWIAETEKDGIVGQVFLTQKNPHELFDPEHPYMLLSSFRVKPAFRNLGLGTLLLKACEIAAGDRGIQRIFLNCARSNQRSRAFYERNGYSVFRDDPGRWSYIDHLGQLREEIDPAWTMVKVVNQQESEPLEE